jgi:enoyl-CoA hydratase/carnithine racemase
VSERVSISINDGVADVRLNRPEKLNALDGAMFSAITRAGQRLAEDKSVRAVVLSGEGRAFCAGLDFSGFRAMTGGDGAGAEGGAAEEPAKGLLASSDEGPANNAQRPAWIWRELPVPVIAAVHGVAFGGGLQIALAADIRIVAPDARLSVMEIKWGLIPDMTGTQTLRHLVRLDVARELTYTGRIVAGREAVEIGLATQMSDSPREAALEMAREIAGKSPHAIRAAKQLLSSSNLVSVEEGLGMEASLQASLIARPNQIEAVKANLEKRDPAFQDPE